MKQSLLPDALTTRPLCCDGAMGTQLLAHALTSSECGMLWNVDHPNRIGEVHAAYLDAGCELITTNSFGGAHFALENHGLADRVAELNRAAAQVARDAAGESAWVLGDVGPVGEFLEPVGEMTTDELCESFTTQIDALLAGGADAILVETMSDPAEAIVGIEAALALDDHIPVITTYAFQKTVSGEFRTMMGKDVRECVQTALDAGTTIVGANCGTSLDLNDYVGLAREIVAAANGAPVILRPNAGSPHTIGDRTVYDAGPEQMGTTALQLLQEGVRIVGGCCGTTPQHLAAISHTLRQWDESSSK